MSRVLVIGPHPDDESIGCGGTLRKHVEEGAEVRAIFLTSGERGGHGRSERDTATIREDEARAAAAILGIQTIEFYRFPDGAMKVSAAASDRLRLALMAWSPTCIYLPHGEEMHPDHRASLRLLKRSLRRCEGYSPRVLMYEVWTPLQQFDEIVDISPFIDIKRAAIRAYRSQCAAMDFDEAALALNRYRGEMHSWPGGDYAEVFGECVVRSTQTRGYRRC